MADERESNPRLGGSSHDRLRMVFRESSSHRFPSLMPVAVFDSLVLTASKILHKEANCVRIDPSPSIPPL